MMYGTISPFVIAKYFISPIYKKNLDFCLEVVGWFIGNFFQWSEQYLAFWHDDAAFIQSLQMWCGKIAFIIGNHVKDADLMPQPKGKLAKIQWCWTWRKKKSGEKQRNLNLVSVHGY